MAEATLWVFRGQDVDEGGFYEYRVPVEEGMVKAPEEDTFLRPIAGPGGRPITGAEGKVDMVRQTTAVFRDGHTHRLRVTVTPLKKLKLSWKESPGG